MKIEHEVVTPLIPENMEFYVPTTSQPPLIATLN
jgi:hypothetical protein